VQGGGVSYAHFLASKVPVASKRGIAGAATKAGHLFDYQRKCVDFALDAGSCGMFLDTGLGKTLVQLDYLEHARHAENGRALLLTPLAVARQIEREAHRFGYQARVIRDQSEAGEGINICNYDRLHLLDTQSFGAVSLDEASILKSFTGKQSRSLIESFNGLRFKMAATATPAPNDHMEIGPYAEFCEVMNSNEMLSRFFINDTMEASQKWRLKRHGVDAFWDWMASWCRLAQRPSDLGGDDTGFDLPPINVVRHRAAENAPTVTGGLFGDDVVSATNLHAVKRETIGKRAAIAADLAMATVGPVVIWCDTDYESDAILAALGDAPGVVEVRGSMKPEAKEAALDAFALGNARVMVTKPAVAGFGLNWQHCHNTVFVGRSFSYEAWYQAVRRFWRFGQKNTVNVHLVVAEGEDSIARVIDRKASDHDSMKAAMRAAMQRNQGRSTGRKVIYNPIYKGSLPSWIA
jgi:superfamily II DNA or RNA helicase